MQKPWGRLKLAWLLEEQFWSREKHLERAEQSPKLGSITDSYVTIVKNLFNPVLRFPLPPVKIGEAIAHFFFPQLEQF